MGNKVNCVNRELNHRRQLTLLLSTLLTILVKTELKHLFSLANEAGFLRSSPCVKKGRTSEPFTLKPRKYHRKVTSVVSDKTVGHYSVICETLRKQR